MKPHVLSESEEVDEEEEDEACGQAPVRGRSNKFGVQRRPTAKNFGRQSTAFQERRIAPPMMNAASASARAEMQARSRSMSPIKTGNNEADQAFAKARTIQELRRR